MSIDEGQLDRIRATLAADDYHIEFAVRDDRADVAITAGPDACDECLAPKSLMAAMLAPALGVPPDTISLVYPTDTPTE